jgi:hypothetical protein
MTSVEVEISTSGLEFEEIAKRLDPELRSLLIERLAEVAYWEAFYGAPWKTGRLARSLQKEVEAESAVIRLLSPYGIYVVAGTAPHEIRPSYASCLAFRAKSGEMVFTRLVRHPGTKPNPFLEEAVEKTRDQVDEVFADLFLELIS